MSERSQDTPCTTQRERLRQAPPETTLADLVRQNYQSAMGGKAPRNSPKEIQASAWLDLNGLSAYSSLSVRKLRNHLKDLSHPLPCHRIGGKILVQRVEYDAWAARYPQMSRSDVDRIVDSVLGPSKARRRGWA